MTEPEIKHYIDTARDPYIVQFYATYKGDDYESDFMIIEADKSIEQFADLERLFKQSVIKKGSSK